MSYISLKQGWCDRCRCWHKYTNLSFEDIQANWVDNESEKLRQHIDKLILESMYSDKQLEVPLED